MPGFSVCPAFASDALVERGRGNVPMHFAEVLRTRRRRVFIAVRIAAVVNRRVWHQLVSELVHGDAPVPRPSASSTAARAASPARTPWRHWRRNRSSPRRSPRSPSCARDSPATSICRTSPLSLSRWTTRTLYRASRLDVTVASRFPERVDDFRARDVSIVLSSSAEIGSPIRGDANDTGSSQNPNSIARGPHEATRKQSTPMATLTRTCSGFTCGYPCPANQVTGAMRRTPPA